MTIETPIRIIRERRPKAPRVTLTVTPEIIETAKPSDSGHCVWADALKEAIPNARRVSVDLQTIRFTNPDNGCRYTYLTPRAAQVDLVNWDMGIAPEPKSIRLRGGMVTRGGQSKVKNRLTPPVPQRAEAVDRGGGGTVADRVGGTTPPVAAYSNVGGRRREFGLRGLGRVGKAKA